MIGIIAASIMGLLAVTVGRRILLLITNRLEADEELLFSFALGCIALVTSILIIGVSGHLNLKSLSVLVLVFGVLSMRGLTSVETSLKKAALLLKFRTNTFFIFASLISAGALLAALTGVISPELANDSLCYHLHVPKIFLSLEKIQRIPYEVNSLFPFFMETLYMLGVAFKSIALAKSFHLMTGLFTAAAIIILGRRFASVYSSCIAAMIFLTTPGILNQLGTTYVDAGLTFFSFLAFYAYLRWHETRQNSWLTLAGILAGAAMGIKFLALITVLGIFLLLLYDLILGKKAKPISALLSFLIPLALVSSYWYLRNWIELGNPVYPYFYSIFKAGDSSIQYNDIGVTKTFLHFLQIPWTMTMHPKVFEGFGDNLGPAYLALIPLAGGNILRSPVLKRAAFYCFFYLICWFMLGQSLRFFFPVLPVLALFIASGLDSILQFGTFARRIVSYAVIFILTVHTALGVYHYRDTFALTLGRISEKDYLREKERSYGIAEYINENLPPEAKILNAVEVRMFYFQRAIVREDVYARDTAYPENSTTPAEVLASLKKDGFTHILLIKTANQNLSKHEPLRVAKFLQDTQNFLALSLTPLYTYSFKGHDQPLITYILYKL